MEMLRHAIEDLHLTGVKFGPICSGVALSDPGLEPVYENCQRNNLPLTMHLGTTFARNAPVDLGRAIHVEPIATKYPDLTMILAHMGHPRYSDCIAVIRRQPNAYAEVSALCYRARQYYNILIEAQEYKVAEIVRFGTISSSPRSANPSMVCSGSTIRSRAPDCRASATTPSSRFSGPIP